MMKTLFTGTKAIGLLFVSLLTFAPNLALAQGGYWGMGPGMMGGWGMGWFGGIFMMLFWVLIIIALVFFIRWLVRTSDNRADKGMSQSRALEILKERYARGEIDTEEFEQRRRPLES